MPSVLRRMPRVQRKQKRERADDRRARLAHQREARHLARRFVIPALLVLLAVLVTYFFLKYGIGGPRTKASA